MGTRTRRFAALLAVVVGLFFVAGTLALGLRTDPLVVGQNVRVNPPGLTSANNSPSIARDPQRPEHLVVAHRVDRPGLSGLLEWSGNGGGSWQPTPLPLPPSDTPCAASIDQKPCSYAPDVAFAPDGTLYVSYVQLEGETNRPARLWVASSTNGGRSLSTPVQVSGPLAFQSRVAVGADGTVHLVWLQAAETGINRLVGPARIVASHSTDRGRTFSTPVPVSDTARERVGAPSPAVDPRGGLVVLYEDFKDDRRDFENLEGPPSETPFALVVSRSDDGGRTFSPGVELESGVVATRRFLVFLPVHPSVASGPGRELYVAWADGRNGDEDVLLRRSGDGGATWGPPVRVNGNPLRDGTDQLLPEVSVSQDGRVDVLFLDRRRDPANVMTDAFLASSGDGGRSFTDRRLSSQSFDSRIGSSLGPAYGTDLGSRLGLDSAGAGAYAVWTDTRLGNPDTGRQDVLGARVGGLGSSRSISWLVWPVLVVAGGLLAWFLVARRSRSGRRPPG